MSEIRKDAIWFDSANGINRIAGYFYSCDDVKPHAILQISHGMCEYIGRYDDFAAYMVRKGYIVCGNDHLGHGATSSGENGIDGYFAEDDGRKFIVQDLYRMNCLAKEKYPGLPVFLLGHSMGSFLARGYAVQYPQTLKALILSGTGGPNPMAGAGILLADLVCRIRGTKYRSDLLQNLAFGQYLKKIESPKTKNDWITRDDAIVEKYTHDPKCTFVFTASAFRELLRILKEVNRPQWAQDMPKDLPVTLVSGDADPVGGYGKGVQQVYHALKNAGSRDVTIRLYPGARHEVLNETNRGEVYADLATWCESHLE